MLFIAVDKLTDLDKKRIQSQQSKFHCHPHFQRHFVGLFRFIAKVGGFDGFDQIPRQQEPK